MMSLFVVGISMKHYDQDKLESIPKVYWDTKTTLSRYTKLEWHRTALIPIEWMLSYSQTTAYRSS